MDGAGREESRCLYVLLCLAFGIFGWEDGIAQAGKGQDEECFLMPGIRNRTKAFLFLKISVSQVLRLTILFFYAFSSPFKAYVGEDALSSAPPKFGTRVKMHMQRVAIDSHVSLFGNLKTLFYR